MFLFYHKMAQKLIRIRENPWIFVYGLILGVLVITVALAWNNLIQIAADQFLSSGSSLIGASIYAVIISIVLIFLALLISKIYPQEAMSITL